MNFSNSEILFYSCDLEKHSELSQTFQVTQVPTIILADSNKDILQRFDNTVPALVLDSLEEHLKIYKVNFEVVKTRMFTKIQKLLAENTILVFIKGTPTTATCQFSK